jgi:hypothetical protein
LWLIAQPECKRQQTPANATQKHKFSLCPLVVVVVHSNFSATTTIKKQLKN